MEEGWTRQREGQAVFIPRESGGTAETPRFTRMGRVKPVREPACLEAGTGRLFAVPSFIKKIKYYRSFSFSFIVIRYEKNQYEYFSKFVFNIALNLFVINILL